MIRSENTPLNNEPQNKDFTIKAYKKLIQIAKLEYKFVFYDAIPWNDKFILWRHDCDFSLNRALALAKIESEEAVFSTYFLNPRSEFYNLHESSQIDLVKNIISLGHKIGLHFDATFHANSNNKNFEENISYEASLLTALYGVKPTALSFHNPTAEILSHDKDEYSGLINCYSEKFQTKISYCSDSNGYWRFNRLHDVLTEAKADSLQVLTHPGWWQENEMWPRQRVLRCIYGRAKAILAKYDNELSDRNRKNFTGADSSLIFLKQSNPELYTFLDYLWMCKAYPSLFMELSSLLYTQINRLCEAQLREQWGVPADEINIFFKSPSFGVSSGRLFKEVFGESWQSVLSINQSKYQAWIDQQKRMNYARSTFRKEGVESSCVFLCEVIESLAAWGRAKKIHYDGLDELNSIDIDERRAAERTFSDRIDVNVNEATSFCKKRWNQLKINLQYFNDEASA